MEKEVDGDTRWAMAFEKSGGLKVGILAPFRLTSPRMPAQASAQNTTKISRDRRVADPFQYGLI